MIHKYGKPIVFYYIFRKLKNHKKLYMMKMLNNMIKYTELLTIMINIYMIKFTYLIKIYKIKYM